MQIVPHATGYLPQRSQILLNDRYQPADLEYPDVVYVFCPEHRSGRPELLYAKGDEDARLWLFDPSLLLDERAATIDSPHAVSEADALLVEAGSQSPGHIDAAVAHLKFLDKTSLRPKAADQMSSPEQKPMEPCTSRDAPVDILLSEAVGGGDDVAWSIDPCESSSNDGGSSGNGQDHQPH
jgi:DNA phosphorothioation-dependent restriction protein DptH